MTRRSDLLWFAVWSVIGAAYALAVVGALTIGLFVLPVPVIATIVVSRHEAARVGLPGLVAGAALPLLYIAYLNRAGPGTVCTHSGGGEQCTDEFSPWPWIAIAVALVAGGALAFSRRSGKGRPRA
jgi:hypothetical protein